MTRSNGLELSRRKVLAGVGGIGAASAGAGMGTSAYFSDTEPFEDNELAAGELDLRIDWQQLYWGMSEDHDQAPYGSAGRPFVSAHPDAGENHVNTGEQSLNSDEFDSVPNDGLVRYTDEDANIQEYLSCETLSNFEDPDDFENDNENYEPEALIDLEDVKPGDRGEVTFSLHLCDNPGYVWIDGEENALDNPLAEYISVQAWYDIDCDNTLDKDGDSVGKEERIVVGHKTTLANFLSKLEKGHQLNPAAYPHVNGLSADDGGVDDDVMATAGKIEWTQAGPTLADDSDGEIYANEEDREYTVVFDDSGNTIILQFTDLSLLDESDLSTVYGFSWKLLDEWEDETTGTIYTSDTEGMYTTEIRGEEGSISNCFLNPCETGGEDVEPFTSVDDVEYIESTEWFYCLDDPGFCFPADETFCVGFEWMFPTWRGDDNNDAQGQEASWDLTFYTEQCRHNPEPTGLDGDN